MVALFESKYCVMLLGIEDWLSFTAAGHFVWPLIAVCSDVSNYSVLDCMTWPLLHFQKYHSGGNLLSIFIVCVKRESKENKE